MDDHMSASGPTDASTSGTPTNNFPAVNVAIDVDEVLALFIPALAEFHNVNYGSSLSAASFVSYDFHKVWGGTSAECGQKMDAFFESVHFKERICPVSGAFEALSSLKSEFNSALCLHVVTARMNKLQSSTLAWLDAHFAGIFDHHNVHFGNHYTNDGSKSRSKAEMCTEIGAICLVDDSQNYANQCAAAGISVLLFGRYPWNSDSVSEALSSATGRVSRVLNWHEAKIKLRERIISELNLVKANSAKLMSVPRPRPAFLPKVAVIQLCSTNDKAANFEKIKRFIEQASMAGASLVCLPEASLFLGETPRETVLNAEPLDGDIFHQMCSLARNFQVWISFCFACHPKSVGSTSHNEQEGKKIYNRHVLVDVLGVVVKTYNKIHLFDSPMAGLEESAITVAGDSLACHSGNPFGNIALTVCYDLRFPQLFAKLCQPVSSGGFGADIILVPSAFTVPTGEAHWEVLLRARAIENQAWVIAAAQCGQHNLNRASYGHSIVIDPWGKVVRQFDGETEGIFVVSLDVALAASIREKMPGEFFLCSSSPSGSLVLPVFTNPTDPFCVFATQTNDKSSVSCQEPVVLLD